MNAIARRTLLAGVAAMLVAPLPLHAATSTILISKDPSCGCCSGWAEHLRAAGFQTKIVDVANLAPIKERLGVPPALASCHTAEIDGYVIEGHVPASAIRRLLAERPPASGLAVPGMPIGSPGMEVPGAAEDTYEVILFGPSVHETYARFMGTKELS